MALEILKKLPPLPGVYIFRNAAQEIIYVGKAKNLYKRVSSYFHKKDTDWKVKELIAEYASIEHVVTQNEAEALLLEAQLIRDYQPKFNTLLKSGNPFIYIVFDMGETPSIELTRSRQRKGTYFGPFMQKQDARRVFDYLVRTFRLMKCKVKLENGCLEYHLGRCPGTCLPNYNPQDYRTRLQLAQDALNGNDKKFIKTLEEQIKLYNQTMQFEKSAHLAKYLKNWQIIFETLKAKFTEKKYVDEVATKLSPYKRNPEQLHEGLIRLQQLLNLPHTPKTIDCFDISHFQSRYIVGSCIRFTDGVPEKNKFRRFKIRTLTEQNDYAALSEIITRRYRAGDLPDIMLIDGGKGQLSAAQQTFPDATIVSLAKREETIYSKAFPQGIILNIQEPAAQLLIALRDYAHHFAIMYHKHLRGKEYLESRKIYHRNPRTY